MITPTNHTTGAFFGVLECDTTESSMDEQSSIDCSQLMDSSTHTGSMQGPLQSVVENPSSQWESNSNVLKSVLEEASVDDLGVMKKETNGVQANRHDIVKASQPPSIDNVMTFSTRTAMANSVVVPAPSRTIHTSNIDPRKAANMSCPPLRSLPSETLHTSNVEKSIAHKKADRTSFPNAPQSIHSLTSDNAHIYNRIGDESDEAAAWVIHLALALFCALILASVLLTFFVIHNYGVVAMMGLVLILCFAGFMAWFVDSTILSKDARLKPIRSTIGNAINVAKEAVIEEVKLFGRDWNQLKLLEEGSPFATEESVSGKERDANEKEINRHLSTVKQKRSLVFKMVMPIFAFRRKFIRRMKKKNFEATKEYVPPRGTSQV